MKFSKKLMLSVVAGLLAMLLYSAPMWWGVLFSPIAQPLTAAGLEADGGGVRSFIRRHGGVICSHSTTAAAQI